MTFLALFACAAVAGCGKKAYRPLGEIREEQAALPMLFLTEKTMQEVLVPGNTPPFVHKESDEICYPALTCMNPDCPAERQGDRPPLFILFDPLRSVDANGEIAYADVPNGRDSGEYIQSLGGYLEPTCPACIKTRDVANETAEQKQQYLKWVVTYVPPKTAKRAEQLKQEYDEAYKRSTGHDE